MVRWRVVLVLGAVAAAGGLIAGRGGASGQPGAVPAVPAGATPSTPAPVYTFERDVIYGQAAGKPLLLNLARPTAAGGPRACIVIIHGGAWREGNRSLHDSLAKGLAEKGFVAATISYRFCPEFHFPAQIEDAKAAVRFLRAHAKDYGIDPDRIGSIGFSAGAHLAMLLGTMDPSDGMEGEGGNAEQPSKVQAVVSFFGPTDMTAADIPENVRPLGRDLIGATLAEDPEAFRRASPLTYVNAGDAAMLLFQGTQDGLVPWSQATAMAEALTQAGVQGRVELVLGAGHGWGGAELDRTLQTAAVFFQRVLEKPGDQHK